MTNGPISSKQSLSKTVLPKLNGINAYSRQMSSNPLYIQIRGFATSAGSKASEAPRGPLGSIFSFLPRWGAPYDICIAETVVAFGRSSVSILF